MIAVHGRVKFFPHRVAFVLFLAASLSAMVQADEVFRVGIIAGDAHRNEFQCVPQKATDGWEFRTYLFADGADEATLKGKLYADMSNDLDMVVFTPIPPKTLIVAGDKENLAMWKSFVGRGGAFAVTDAHDNWWRPLLCGDLGYGLGHESLGY